MCDLFPKEALPLIEPTFELRIRSTNLGRINIVPNHGHIEIIGFK